MSQQRNKEQIIKEMLEYATNQYGCKFPRDFHLILLNTLDMYGVPKKKVIDGIYKEWRVWEKYVKEDGYNYFFQSELKTLFKLQTVSTFSSPVLNAYIGKKVPLKETVDFLPLLATTVTWEGKCILNGKEI